MCGPIFFDIMPGLDGHEAATGSEAGPCTQGAPWTWFFQTDSSSRVRRAGSEQATVEAARVRDGWAGTAVCKTLVMVGQARYPSGEEQGIEANRLPCSTPQCFLTCKIVLMSLKGSCEL